MNSYAQAIYTKKGITKNNIFSGEKVLHFGSGNKKLLGSISVDVLDLPNVDVVHDLDEYPWPFEDSSFDLIYGHNALEHLSNIVDVMNEIHRLLKPSGRLVVTVPYFRSVDAFGDPTHKHFFTSGTLDCVVDSGTTISSYEYTNKRFKKIGFWYGWPQSSSNPLVRFFKNFISKHPRSYDSHISLIFPVKIVVWELEVIKNGKQ